MSSEVTKPVVTKAGRVEIKPEETKKGFFSRRKKHKKLSVKTEKGKVTTRKIPKSKQSNPSSVKNKVNKKKLTLQQSKRVHVKHQKAHLPGNKIAFISVVALLMGLIGFGIIFRGNGQSAGVTLSDRTGTNLLGERTKSSVVGIGVRPDFKVLVIKDLPGDQQQYDEEIGVFFFQDNLAGAVIRVNEQQLPLELIDGSNTVKNIALSKEDVRSISQLETNKGPIYLGNLESGGQVAIFDFDNLLLFIESTSVVSPEAWVEYINELSY